MNKRFTNRSYFLIACLFVLSISPQLLMAQDKGATHHFQSRHCINLEIPNDWTFYEDYEGMLVHITAPDQTESLPENVNVTAEFIGGKDPNKSFQQYMISSKQLLAEHSPEHEMIEVKMEQLEHYQAYSWLYTTITDNIALKIKQYFVYIGGTVYTLTYMGNHIEYKLTVDEAEAMIHSFYLDID